MTNFSIFAQLRDLHKKVGKSERQLKYDPKTCIISFSFIYAILIAG